MEDRIDLGIIGGSGLYTIDSLSREERKTMTTPFGSPSGDYLMGNLGNTRVAFLPRHGLGHTILPSELNYRANIYGFKMLGAERILAITAVGSLRKEIRPLDMVVPDQFFDRTTGREDTFFGDGLVAHVSLADPVCPELSEIVTGCARETGARTHSGKTLITIGGPGFASRTESRTYRQWGMDIIGMTTYQEAKLAREAEICYSALAMVTDYDSWMEEEEEVTVDAVVRNMKRNTANAKTVIELVAAALPGEFGCSCGRALENAIMTEPEAILPEVRERFRLLAGKYLD
jgi:5'-methylthioadenosine phosphorylase